jgi:hypothetical protein
MYNMFDVVRLEDYGTQLAIVAVTYAARHSLLYHHTQRRQT